MKEHESYEATYVCICGVFSYLGRDQRMTPPESPREVREVREAGLLQTLEQNREQGDPLQELCLELCRSNLSSVFEIKYQRISSLVEQGTCQVHRCS